MAKKILNYDDSANNGIIGTLLVDSPDDYGVRTFGGDDTITFYVDGIVDIYAGDGDDSIVANGSGTGNVYGMSGGEGFDILDAEFGNDIIHGGGNTDTIRGNDGNDRIYGDGSNDFLYGGAGNDSFVYITTADSFIGSGIDKIQDFGRTGDKIDLNLIDANSALAGNQAFTWAGMSYPEVNKAGNLWGQFIDATVFNPSFVRVHADINGDGTSDMQIDVIGVTTLAATDFIL
jgi:serralysin